MITTLDGLRGLRTLDAIRNALDQLSGPHRLLKSYEFVYQSKTRLTLFLELNGPIGDAEVRKAGAYGFGNKLCLDLLLGERPAAGHAAAA